MISRSAFYPTVPDHVTEYSFARRRQSLMWRPLRLHELLQNVPLPHVGIGTAHFGFILYQRTEIPLAAHYRLVPAEEAKAFLTAADSFAQPHDKDPSSQGLECSTAGRLTGSGIFGGIAKGAPAFSRSRAAPSWLA
jgi:hypothetical protein